MIVSDVSNLLMLWWSMAWILLFASRRSPAEHRATQPEVIVVNGRIS
jgi:hypothetical protein